jgi:arylsulfatase A-like enzyme
MSEVLDMALPWLREYERERFFLFLHSFDVHRYNPPHMYAELSDNTYRGPLKKIRDRRPADLEYIAVGDGFYALDDHDLAFLMSLYDSEIRTVDEQLARLFAELKNLNLLENTTVILTSDHGESFAEHGSTGHAFTLYGPALHVPLLIRVDGVNHQEVGQRVQTVDVAPTIFDLLGLTASKRAEMQGNSLARALSGQAIPDRPIICEADALDTQASVYSGRFKYINYGILSHSIFDHGFLLLTLKGLLSPYAKGEELFDLRNDPGELFDLSANDPERTAEFRSYLMRSIRHFRQRANSRKLDDGSAMSPELEEQLRTLGYIE